MKRRIHQNVYGNWIGYVGRRREHQFGSDEVAAYAWLETGLYDNSEESAQAWLDANKRLREKREDNPMKHFRPPFHVDFHSERGEVSIYVTDADDNEVWYGNDETVRELIEDGFIDAKGFIMGRNARPEVLERSVISYLRSVGVIPEDEPRGSNDISVYEDARYLYDDSPTLDYDREPSRFDSDGRDLSKPWPRRKNPGDVHIDIHSHNTRDNNPRNPQYDDSGMYIMDEMDELLQQQRDAEKMIEMFTAASRVRNSPPSRVAHNENMIVLWTHNRDAIKNRLADLRYLLGDRSKASHRPNPTEADVAGWVDHYREKMMTRVDGVPEKAHYVVKITTKDGEEAWLRVGKGTKFDTDPSKARVYRNGDKANEAATKVLNYLKKKQPAKAKKIQSISAEPKK